jgi:hypothetical protein
LPPVAELDCVVAGYLKVKSAEWQSLSAASRKA